MNDNMRQEDDNLRPGYSFAGEYDDDDPALANACQTLTGGGWPYYTQLVAEKRVVQEKTAYAYTIKLLRTELRSGGKMAISMPFPAIPLFSTFHLIAEDFYPKDNKKYVEKYNGFLFSSLDITLDSAPAYHCLPVAVACSLDVSRCFALPCFQREL